MQQTVDVVGYPIGGDTVSITRGVVSRIDFVPYAQSGGESQLCVQVDAAINPGNSGGPALSNGKLVGIAFQGLNSEEASNVGYIIPITLLSKVLDEFKSSAVKSGLITKAQAQHSHLQTGKHINWPKQKGHPDNPLVKLRNFSRFEPKYQNAENPFLRQSLSLPKNESGVVIRSVPLVSNLHGVLQNNDVLVEIDGIKVGNEGRVSCYPLQPMDFNYIISQKLVGEPIIYTIFRGGKKMVIETTAENPPRRSPLISKDSFVPYVMFAGFVFSPLARDSAITEDPFEDFAIKSNADLLLARKKANYTSPNQQTVVLCSTLPHRINIGYEEVGLFMPLNKINDVDINNISDVALAVAKAAKDPTKPLITFEFCDDDCIVLPVVEGFEATWEIQQDFGMSRVFSKDVAAVLAAAGFSLVNPDGENQLSLEDESSAKSSPDKKKDKDISGDNKDEDEISKSVDEMDLRDDEDDVDDDEKSDEDANAVFERELDGIDDGGGRKH
jgi:hypothetical protein